MNLTRIALATLAALVVQVGALRLRLLAHESPRADHHSAENKNPTDNHTTRRVVGLGVACKCDATGSDEESKDKHRDGSCLVSYPM